MVVHHPVGDESARPPYGIQGLVAAEQTATVAHKIGQHLEFQRGSLHPMSVAPHFLPGNVHLHFSKTAAFGFFSSHPAVRFVPFRVQEGDDASCLNLNRVSRPRLLGVNPRELADRKSFSFVETLPSLQGQDTWMALDEIPADGPVPALADQTVLTWALGKAVGDTLEYVAEDGRPFRIRLVAGLANSIFQGSLIVSEKALLRYFPSHSGHRFFLADVPPDQVGKLTERLSWALSLWP